MRQIERSALARYSIALIASAVTSSMAFAQQPLPTRQAPPRPAASARAPQRQAASPGARQGQSGRGGQAARGGKFGPRGGAAGMLIAMKAQLDLTDDQVKKLEALRNAPHPKPNEAEALRARADMLEATQGDGDLNKARAALDKMSRLRNDAQIARLKERQDVRNVLTASQKTKLDNMRGEMRGKMRRGMKAGMRQGMRGGRGQPAMQGGTRQRFQQGMQQGMRMRQGMGGGQGFAPGGRRGGMGAPGGAMGPGMGPGMMGPGMGPGVGPGDTGPNGTGSMRPAMGRRGQPIEPDVNVDKRPPVPPSDSLSIR